MDSISPTVYRRFILGAQGLWPGRRWEGKTGTAQAIRSVQAVQVDPVAVVAQSHDIALWGRVRDYQPQHLRELVYTERKFFEYHHTLMIYPIEDFPFWHQRMERQRQSPSMAEYYQANQTLLEQVRTEIRTRGPLRSRDLEGKRVNRYRSTKDSGIAMFYMWLTGELTIHSRIGRDRVYDFTENLIPKRWLRTASEAETDKHFLRKALIQHGLCTQREFKKILKSIDNDEPQDAGKVQAMLDEMLAGGELHCVQLEGTKETLYYPAESQTLLQTLSNGDVPAEWTALDTTGKEEVIFLAPLEFVSARGRAKGIFNFDYTWEIYKPAHTRMYGPYTLPVLYGDRLVARLDSKLDRQSGTLILNGLWLEEDFKANGEAIPEPVEGSLYPNKAFNLAFARGLGHFAQFLEAKSVDLGNLEPGGLRKVVKQYLKSVGIKAILWSGTLLK